MKRKIFIAAAVFFSSYAQAQQDTTAKSLDEVIITANKFPQKQSSTGKVISLITKEQIEKSSGRTLTQILNEQAGITISGSLNNLGTNQTLFMRGASSGRTLILVDGIPVNDPTSITNDFDLNLFSLNDIERVEIARGAQSTLYGSDGIAGVVNIITIKKDVTKLFNVKTTLAGGNYGTFRGNVQVFGKADKFTYTTRYAKLFSKGFSAAYDSTGSKNFERDSYNGDVASASLQYQLSSDFSLKTFIQNSRYKTDIDASIFTDEKDFTSKNRSLITGAGFNYRKNKVSVTGNYQYTENKRNFFNDSSDVPSFSKFSTNDYFGQTQFVELYSSIELGNNFTLLHGADYRFAKMNSSFFSVSSFGPFTSLFNDTSLSQASTYTSLFYHSLSEKINIELGGRLNVHSRYGNNQTYTFNPSYSFSDHFRIFGSIATGFKAPTLFQLYSSSGKRDLKPERSKTYEIGLQQMHNKIATRLVYFHRNIKDGIDFDFIKFKYFNFNVQKVNGIELETTIRPVDNFTITANYTYLDPEEISQSRLTFKDTTYPHLLRRSKHNFNLSVGYQFNNGLYLSANGKYVGNRFDVGGFKKQDVLLESYFILGAYAEYKLKSRFKLFADAQNITNKKFFDVRGFNSIPFIIIAGITFNW
jgi:vitamin B12 transporter